MINDACAVPVTSERVVYSVKDKISVLQMCTDCFFFANFQVQKCTCLGNLIAHTIDIVISQRNYDSVLSLTTTLQRGAHRLSTLEMSKHEIPLRFDNIGVMLINCGYKLSISHWLLLRYSWNVEPLQMYF